MWFYVPVVIRRRLSWIAAVWLACQLAGYASAPALAFTGQAVEDESHLRHHALRADVPGAPDQGGTDLGRLDETQESLLRIGARSDDGGVDLLAACQRDPVDRAS